MVEVFITFQEKDLQAFITNSVANSGFAESIQGCDEIRQIANMDDADRLPQFSIDHLVRVAQARAAVRALESLFSLRILVADRDISVTSHQVLRPDIIAIDEATGSLVIFELKKSGQTGRQALTELLAYEHELRNVLPFLPSHDTFFVLISTEWSTLMDHAAASAVAWAGKILLCLDAVVDVDTIQFKVRIPRAWYITGSVHFPEDALSCYTVCLYNYKLESMDEAGDLDQEPIDQRLICATEMIAREGDLAGGHGFVLLWRDYASFSSAPYNLTVCGISPIAFYRSMRQSGIIVDGDNTLIKALDQGITDSYSNSHSDSLLTLSSRLEPMLKSICDPMIETLSDWRTQELELKTRALPVYCDFWGLLGRYVRDFWIHPAVLKHKAMFVNPAVRDWHNPGLALPLLESFYERKTFLNGNVCCSDAFRLGISVGLDMSLRRMRRDAMPDLRQAATCRLAWLYFELKDIFEEVRLLTDAAKNVPAPSIPIEIHANPDAEVEEKWQFTLGWLADSFLCASPIHVAYLLVGANASLVFDSTLRNRFSLSSKRQVAARISEQGKQLLRSVFELAKRNCEAFPGHPSSKLAASISQTIGLDLCAKKIDDVLLWISVLEPLAVATAVESCLPLADSVFPVVPHEHAAAHIGNIDWAWLQQGINEMRERGTQHPAVHLLADGNITTGPADFPELEKMDSAKNPMADILFCNHSNGLLVIHKTTWMELKSGKWFDM